jgi:NAD(P)-dependent dehydrogenase (short-subunit alcohol dehydrogenase family)
MDEVCFVTGGSRGVGRAIVEAFRAAGYKVAACATSADGAAAGEPDLALACDLRDPSAIKAALDETVRALGGLTVVVNNAGVAGSDVLDVADLEDEHWTRTLDVNLSGAYHVCKHALAALPDGRGRILNIGSTLSHRGVPDGIAYCASKHGLIGLTRALAKRLATRGVTVNAVCPGWVRTDMATQRASELNTDTASLAASVPIGRMLEPDEVAAMCVYLASPEAAGVTGQSFNIDGGSTA